MSRMPSTRRMLSPPGGILNSSSPGMTIFRLSSPASTTPVDSTVSCMHLSATHEPQNRDIAQP